MRIAVPTTDGFSLSAHFGQSTGFLIFDVQDGKVTSSSVRANGGCHSHGAHDHSCHSQASTGHDHQHSGIVSTLEGCDIVICSGIGMRAADALAAGGIQPVFVRASGAASEIVEAYVSGKLTPASTGGCQCNH